MPHAHVDRRVFGSFGLASAVGGLLGALAHSYASSPVLAVVFGVLLVFAGGAEITGLAARMRFSRRVACVAGAVSGVFGGMVGNQGGIRSAALLGLEVRKEELVGTATAIALLATSYAFRSTWPEVRRRSGRVLLSRLSACGSPMNEEQFTIYDNRRRR